jgi:hypothetical protein
MKSGKTYQLEKKIEAIPKVGFQIKHIVVINLMNNDKQLAPFNNTQRQ